MNLSCDIVRDLYVLYKSGNLRDGTRKIVDEHIKTCEDCRTIYEQKGGFQKIFIEEKNLAASKETDDEKSILKVRGKRLRIGAVIGFLVIVLVSSSLFAVSSYDSYISERYNLARNMDMGVWQLKNLDYYVNYVKEDRLEQLLQETQVDILKFEGYIHNKEKLEEAAKRQGSSKFKYLKENPMYIDSLGHLVWDIDFITGPSVSDCINKRESKACYAAGNDTLLVNVDFMLVDALRYMQNKYKSGKWTNEDEEAFNTIRKYIFNYYVELAKQTRKLNAVSGSINTGEEVSFFRKYSLGKMIKAAVKPEDIDVKGLNLVNKQLKEYVGAYCKRNNIYTKTEIINKN